VKILFFIFISLHLYALEIIEKPIVFDTQRITLSKKYINEHYGLKPKDISIIPRLIVVHWTAENDFNKSFQRFKRPTLSCDRADIRQASALNVSTHFLISRQGKVYRLMPETYMARHVIGLNYSSIAIENVGGENNENNLTPLQLQANIQLIHYLKDKYKSLEYIIGHHEYTQCESLDLWLEKDKDYKTEKHDPGKLFMRKIRHEFPNFKTCSKYVQ